MRSIFVLSHSLGFSPLRRLLKKYIKKLNTEKDAWCCSCPNSNSLLRYYIPRLLTDCFTVKLAHLSYHLGNVRSHAHLRLAFPPEGGLCAITAAVSHSNKIQHGFVSSGLLALKCCLNWAKCRSVQPHQCPTILLCWPMY